MMTKKTEDTIDTAVDTESIAKSCVVIAESVSGEIEQQGVISAEDIIDTDIMDSFPEEHLDVKASIINAAKTAKLVELRYGVSSAIVVVYGDNPMSRLLQIFPTDNSTETIDLPAYSTIHLLMLYAINGVDALACLQRLGGISEVDNYNHLIVTDSGIRMHKKNQAIYQFIRSRKDGRNDITRAVFIAEPCSELEGVSDCVATYDLAKDRFVHINNGDKVFKSTKEAKEYAKDYARSAPAEHGDEEAGSSSR